MKQVFFRFDDNADEAIKYLNSHSIAFSLVECVADSDAAKFVESICGSHKNLFYLSRSKALVEPTIADLNHYLSLEGEGRERHNFDIIVLGAGPAGMTTGIYASRGNLSTLILEEMIPGGLMTKTDVIENYPGFPEPVGGFELSDRMKKQADRFGASFHYGRAGKVVLRSSVKEVVSGKKSFYAPVVVVALGTEPRKAGIPGEDEYYMRGVSYCATCDGPLYRGKEVIVIGGGDSAVQEAIYLANICSKVTVVHRRDELRADKFLAARAFATDNIEFIWNSIPKEVLGDNNGMKAVRLFNKVTEKYSDRTCDGMFVFIGLIPKTKVEGLDALDFSDDGFIIADCHTKTKLPGVFTAGDIRAGNFRQIATAVGDGCIASHSAALYINAIELPEFAG